MVLDVLLLVGAQTVVEGASQLGCILFGELDDGCILEGRLQLTVDLKCWLSKVSVPVLGGGSDHLFAVKD